VMATARSATLCCVTVPSTSVTVCSRMPKRQSERDSEQDENGSARFRKESTQGLP
jgi:hypothetical protein